MAEQVYEKIGKKEGTDGVLFIVDKTNLGPSEFSIEHYDEILESQELLNPFITVSTQEQLTKRLEDLEHTDKKGVLHKLPFVVKDNIDTVDWPTTGACKALHNKYPSKNSSLVDILYDQGAVILGKVSMHELAFGVTTNNGSYGAVKNPHNHTRIPGGSSGGTAAAISCGLVQMGFGSDTGGSTRIPASMTGICGMRPSIGKYPGDGVINLSTTRDTVGPMGQSMNSVRLVHQAVVGDYERPNIVPSEI